jgi:hypothetical protein
MSEILLPAFHVTTVRKIQVEASYEMGLDLDRYKSFYRQSYNADVTEADLVREMARRFMEADKEFQAFKSAQKPKGRGPARGAPVVASEEKPK